MTTHIKLQIFYRITVQIPGRRMLGESGRETAGSRKEVLLETIWMFSGTRYNPDALTLPLTEA